MLNRAHDMFNNSNNNNNNTEKFVTIQRTSTPTNTTSEPQEVDPNFVK